MWGRKDQPESPSTPTTSEATRTPPAVQPSRPAREARPASGAPTVARLGKSLKFKGDLSGKEDLYIDGELDGKVQLEDCDLTIGPNGTVKADIRARSVMARPTRMPPALPPLIAIFPGTV